MASVWVMQNHDDIIHGHQRRKNCLVVAIEDIVQVGAQPWFGNPFDDSLCKGVITEWPKNQTVTVDNLSPLHTRHCRRRAK